MVVTDKFLLDIQDYCKTFILNDAECVNAKKDINTTSNHYEFLFEVVRRLRPKTIIELGTHWGVSAMFMSKACQTTKIYTVDNNFCNTPNIGKYLKGLSNVEFINGDVLDQATADRMPDGVDIIFADTEKEKDFLDRQLSLYYPKMKDRGYMFLDDILSEAHYPQAYKWWTDLDGCNKMDLPHIHVGYEIGVIIK